MKSIGIWTTGLLTLLYLPVALAQKTPPQENESAQESQLEAEDHAAQFKDIKLPEGPMRVEPWSFSETRSFYMNDPPAGGVKSNLILRAKLTGDRLIYLAGRGEMIVEEMVDDTGKVLLSTKDFEPRELTRIYPLRAGKRMMQAGYAAVQVTGEASSRDAKKLKKVKGYVNAVYAKRTEEILIDNPLQFAGGLIEHPKLKEIGLKIKVLDPEGRIKQTGNTPALALQYLDDGEKYIRMIDFYDAWLKPLYAREQPRETPEGEPYRLYTSMVGKIDADAQLMIKYYPEIEEERVQFEFTDLDLP